MVDTFTVTLPPEIIGLILEFVQSQSDIISAACGSHTLQREAERLLYRKLQVKIDHRDPKFEAVLKRPEFRGSLVVHLEIYSRNSKTLRWDTILNYAQHLSVLGMRYHGPAQLLSTYPFQLREFETELDVDDNMLRFLASQPSITILHLHSLDSPISRPLSTKILPRLQELTCMTKSLRHILPGRHIIKLKPLGVIEPENYQPLCASLKEVAGTLQDLNVSLESANAEILSQLVAVTPKLKRIQLFDCSVEVNNSIYGHPPRSSKETRHVDWSGALSGWNVLETLRFSTNLFNCPQDESSQAPIVRAWAAFLPALRTLWFEKARWQRNEAGDFVLASFNYI